MNRHFLLILSTCVACGSADIPAVSNGDSSRALSPPPDVRTAATVDSGSDSHGDVPTFDGAVADAADAGALQNDSGMAENDSSAGDAACDASTGAADAGSDFLCACATTCSPGLKCVVGDPKTPVPSPWYKWCTHDCLSDGDCGAGKCSGSGICYLPIGF